MHTRNPVDLARLLCVRADRPKHRRPAETGEEVAAIHPMASSTRAISRT